ncbi:RHS repeat-associated core domain-containing protein [Desulfosporosinus sp. OT]|uniref:RHS repeat-associated core domain-containing protein n=1 Tax=Desulfosporosinus sp. OT TaxID=913865 RepID=UPI0002239CDF|nr:RHS repeat-associated core domain-containing protein [Desulfosporosinus sp. OT]EGW39338.1 cell wall-associated domain protein [Desulfosporosinus sp. OT]
MLGYYAAGIGRFLTKDTYLGSDLNRYAYAGGDPVNIVDPTGYFWETILDMVNLVYDVVDFFRNPSWGGAGYVGWDVVSIVPFIPGSYAGKAVKAASKVDEVVDTARGTKAAKGASEVIHGNSKLSTKVQHGYEIFENETGDVVKTGISERPLNKNGTSPRANSQVNSFNNAAGFDKYGANVVAPYIPGRQAALDWEANNAMRLWGEGNSMGMHRRPQPWK